MLYTLCGRSEQPITSLFDFPSFLPPPLLAAPPRSWRALISLGLLLPGDLRAFGLLPSHLSGLLLVDRIPRQYLARKLEVPVPLLLAADRRAQLRSLWLQVVGLVRRGAVELPAGAGGDLGSLQGLLQPLRASLLAADPAARQIRHARPFLPRSCLDLISHLAHLLADHLQLLLRLHPLEGIRVGVLTRFDLMDAHLTSLLALLS